MAWYDLANTAWGGRGGIGSSASGATGASSGNLTGATSQYSSSYGGVPSVPDPTTSAATAISGNVGNLGSLYQLAGNQNQFAAQQAVAQQNVLTPGYSGNMSQWSSDIADLLAGKISSGTVNSMEQAAAESGISTGLQGSQTNNSALLRALGLTSEGLQQQGATQLASQISSSPRVSAFDMTPYLTTAADQQSAQYAANTLASAANPAASAAAGISAANSGVSAGNAAAGGGSSSGSSIASLLQSILGTGTGSGGGGSAATLSGGATGAATTGTGNQSFQDWYNSVYGNTVQGGGLGNSFDSTGAYDNYA